METAGPAADAADVAATRELVHRYADAVCRRDTAAWGATWAPEATWDIGRGEVHGREAIVAAYERAMELFEGVVQLAHNGTASIEGDIGRGRWYMSEHARTRTGRALLYLGYYDDEYRRGPTGWQFTRRQLTWLYQGPPDMSGSFGPPPGYGPARSAGAGG